MRPYLWPRPPQSVADGKRHRLENCLNSIIAGLGVAAEGVKAHRLKLECGQERATQTPGRRRAAAQRGREDQAPGKAGRQLESESKDQRVSLGSKKAAAEKPAIKPIIFQIGSPGHAPTPNLSTQSILLFVRPSRRGKGIMRPKSSMCWQGLHCRQDDHALTRRSPCGSHADRPCRSLK